MSMERVVQRVNEIADADVPDREKVFPYMVAVLDTQIGELIRRDLNGEPGLLRKEGFVDIADAIGA